MFILISLLYISAYCKSNFGTCELNDLFNDKFEIARYMGKWYEIARSKEFPLENGECATALLDINTQGNVDVLNSEILNGKLNQAKAIGYKTSNSNMLLLRFEYNLNLANYIVVDTDYVNYSVVYSCSGNLTHRNEYVWILSRQRTLDKKHLNKLLELIKNKLNISESDLYFTNQNQDICKLN